MSDDPYKGRRFRLIQMGPDPDPVPPGSTGVVRWSTNIQGSTQLMVEWDPHVGRTLNLSLPEDKIEWIDE